MYFLKTLILTCIIKGWISPIHITSSGTYVVPQSCNDDSVFLIDHGIPQEAGEFFLIENRWKECPYDRQLEHATKSPYQDRQGLAIWHVHWPIGSNPIGSNLSRGDAYGSPYPDDGLSPAYPGRHAMVELIQSDGTYDIQKPDNNRGDRADLFKKSTYLQHGNAGYRIG